MARKPVMAIGDIFIHLPFFRSLRHWAPNAEITAIPGFGGKPLFEELLAPLVNPLVDHVIRDTFPDPDRTSYDMVFDLEGHAKTSFLLRRLARRRFYTTAGYGLLNLPNLPVYHGKHTAKRYLRLLKQASRHLHPDFWPWPVPPAYQQAAELLLPAGPTYVVIAPGAGHKESGKLWPLDRFIELTALQSKAGRTPVIILGDQETDWQQHFEHIPNVLFPLSHDVGNATGVPKDPVLTVALAVRAAVAVANCSGPGHMFATGGAPLVSIFGPTNSKKLAPFSRKGICLRPPNPKSKNISDVSLAMVLSAVDEMIEPAVCGISPAIPS